MRLSGFRFSASYQGLTIVCGTRQCAATGKNANKSNKIVECLSLSMERSPFGSIRGLALRVAKMKTVRNETVVILVKKRLQVTETHLPNPN
jgi:hypothetical protein